MSSTNRGARRIRSDNYPTPDWCTEWLLDWIEASMPLKHGGTILEPCAGSGAILKVLLDRGFDKTRLVANELVKDHAPALKKLAGKGTIGSYLDRPFAADTIITNPPFSLAQEFVEKGVQEADTAIFLLPQSFMGSKKRSAFLARKMPEYSLIMRDRPVFCWVCTADRKACGENVQVGVTTCPRCGSPTKAGSDSLYYGWFIWRKSWTNPYSKTYLLTGPQSDT